MTVTISQQKDGAFHQPELNRLTTLHSRRKFDLTSNLDFIPCFTKFAVFLHTSMHSESSYAAHQENK